MGHLTPSTNDNELLSCLRWDEEGDIRLRHLTTGEWNNVWHLIEAGAGQHFLARRLQFADTQPPDEIAAKLRTHTMGVAAKNLAGRSILADALRETGKPALLLKGVDLAERLYGNLGLRPMGDVDFLVRLEDIGPYDRFLRSRGYEATPRFDDSIITSRSQHHLNYRSSKQNAPIMELHWRLADEEYDRDIDVDGIWRRAIAHSELAPGAFIMAPDDLFLYLCLHLKHHTFETSLTQIWDLAEILRAQSQMIDWRVVWARAKDWGLTEATNIALYLVSITLGVSTQHISAWTPDATLVKQLPDILSHLGRYPYSDQVVGHRIAILLSSHSSWAERYRAVLDGALPPRAEIRARYGEVDDGLWADCLSYLRRWRYLLRVKGRVLVGRFRRLSSVTAHVDRVAALRRHLDVN